MVTWENYEEYLMLHTDGELRPDEVAELYAFAVKHPEVKKEMDAYKLTRIAPDATQIYAHKDLLLKPIPNKRVIAFPGWIKYGIAAALAALVFMYRQTTPTPKGAFHPVAEKTHTPKGDGLRVAPPPTPKGALPQVVETPIAKGASARVAEKSHTPKGAFPRVAGASGTGTPANTVETLPVARAKQMPCVNNELPVPGTPDIYGYAGNVKHNSRIGTLWKKVPLGKRNKEQIEKVAGIVAGAYDGVAHAKQNLDHKSLSLKVENDQLVLSLNTNN